MRQWTSVKDRLPSKRGTYLVTYGSISDLTNRYIKTVEFAENLNKIDIYDFPKREFNRAGFYNYDREYGYYEETEVIAWIEPPAVYGVENSKIKDGISSIEILGDIKAEIEQERVGYPPSAGYYKAITKCLQIIDKYMKGSEE